MKKNILLPLLIASSLLANELSWVDEQVNAIKPNRNGVSNRHISKLRSPFIYLKKNLPEKSKTSKKSTSNKYRSTPNLASTSNTNNISNDVIDEKRISTPNSILTLKAIMNSSALINGDWYKLGDKIHRYKIIKITNTSVTLVKNKKITLLSTKSSTRKLKFK